MTVAAQIESNVQPRLRVARPVRRAPFVGNGMWVTQVSDPDGYALTFESPTHDPEETILSDGR